MKLAVAPGGLREMRENGVGPLVERATGAPLKELSAQDASAPGSVLIGMRVDDPGRQVPGTRGGFECALCALCEAEMRLAPSGQALAANGVPTWCLQCFSDHEQQGRAS